MLTLKSKEIIQNEMLNNISNEYDKTRGSFFYDATMPVAIECENLYALATNMFNSCFIETAKGSLLDKKVLEQGIYRKKATYSTTIVTIKGLSGSKVTIDDIVASDTVNFRVTENKIIDDTGIINVLVKCDEAGSNGNIPVGAIKYFPVTIEGLVSVTNKKAVDNGFNAETDDELRQRYIDKIKKPAVAGNKQNYINWSKEIPGVYDAKIFPLWNGPGTVKVVVLDNNKQGASTELLNTVYRHIENERPIGASVSVFAATQKVINISLKIEIDKSYTIESIKKLIEKNLTNYFQANIFKMEILSINKLGSLIFSIPGIIDYSNFRINNDNKNINIADEEIAILGGVTFE